MVDNTDPTTLLATFGLSEFRPGQREVVDAVASGEDVMCVMPTGGGKSLCYQLPSLSKKGTTIVVSPLIALMKDQVDGLKKLGIRASLINSSLSAAEQTEVLNEMASGNLNLVYVAPERLRNSRFLDAISNININLLAIDEAHCVSEWGHDFRPDYSRLGRFRERYLRDVQTIALTATATPMVRDDISVILRLKTPQVFVTGFARTNLRFSVTHAKSDREKDEELTRYIRSQKGSGIIYAATRKRCEELAQWLPEKTRRPIGAYHAGLEPAQRQRVQDDFMSGKLSAIVATNAFGMGIDKADIRFVVHYNIPGSLEAYYQEAGRAGRDGQNSECRLMFSYSDRYIQEFFIENRYPQRETVKSVYDFLLTRKEDPIELTLEQIREEIGVKEGTEAIGTAQTLLAKSGVLRRLDSASNHAIVRIESDVETLMDFLPKEAKLRRKVMAAIERMVGRQRREDVYVRLPRLADMAGVDSDQLKRTLRELNRLRSFDYIPPFRGRAVHLVQQDLTFEQLEIDFEDLNTRKRAEFDKLEAVIKFARTAGCRQRVILQYFGEEGAGNCGLCDRCQPNDGSPGRSSDICLASDIEGIESSSLLRGIQVVLSGVTRMHGRFGKNMVAQMLCGSKNKKLQQWKLHQLSTYGLLSGLRQTEVVNVMDALIETGLLQQKEVDERRPTLHMTEDGRRVMRSEAPLPTGLQLPLPLAKRLAKATGKIEAADVQSNSIASGHGNSEGKDGETENPQSLEMAEKLKRWRRKNSAALGIPAYRVLTNATIDRIAESCPKSREDLESISGVGPATMEQFGDDIIDLVGSVLSDSARASQKTDGVAEESANQGDSAAITASQTTGNIDSEPKIGIFRSNSGAAAVPELPTGDNVAKGEQAAYWTWRLFSDGYSESDVMAIRHCDSAELVSQLLLAMRNGLIVDPDWITDEHGTERLRKSGNGPAVGG
ncbi:MAG: helicase [Planctomycetaceae bacterium TMED240]|nr:helicase [Rhodopirellula sp.]OUX07335.1 MAG: helicase [Planctomycetaceae bacterium TMED240]